MKIIHRDIKKGIVKLKVDNREDLWYLSQLIEPGDFVSGKTFRKIKIGGAEDRAQKVAKKAVFLKIKAEKVEFTSDSLRILGIIEEGPDDIARGSHHSFNIEENTIITIGKEWLKFQLDKLNEAAQEKISKILIVVFDREEAYFAMMKKYGYEMLSHIEGNVQKKDDDTKVKGNFYSEIIKQIQEYDKRYNLNHVILASPAFWKEELYKELKDDEIKKRITQATCSSATKNAINEVLKRDEVRKALHQDRVVKEINLVEELLQEISKNNLAAYGFNEVENAVIAGAVNILLITDGFIQKAREGQKYGKLENMMKTAEKNKGTIVIVASDHDGGRKLDGLGGVGAILRYKLNY